MSDRRLFLDTNVLVYLFDNDEPEKQAVAKSVFQENDRIFFSTQVLEEFYVTVTRKLARPLDLESAYQAVQKFSEYSVEVIRPPAVLNAIRRSIESRISLWDALIVETALYAKAEILLTEDLDDGWIVAGMSVENPFKS